MNEYEFPEDNWINLSDNLDCNSWTDDMTGEKYMSVYEVIDKKTKATNTLATYILKQL